MSASASGPSPATSARMKAVVYYKNGPPDVLKLEELPRPMPKDDEVLIRVRAASVNPLDWRIMRGMMHGFNLQLRKPVRKQMGVDAAGEVESIGTKVRQFKPGDAVFGLCTGAFAEYAIAPESALVTKPQSVSFEQAASSPVAGYTALQGLRDRGRLQPGHNKVLIIGASGGVGTFAVQIAKWLGADVTAVSSSRNVQMVRSLGADRVIDYTFEDFTTLSDRYDLILDCVGSVPLGAAKRVMTPKGKFLLVGAPHNISAVVLRISGAFLLSRLGARKFTFFIARSSQPDLKIIGELMSSGAVHPVIDRVFSLPEVPEAIRYSEAGHARGKIVITVAAEARARAREDNRAPK